jgi:hypothetical protein
MNAALSPPPRRALPFAAHPVALQKATTDPFPLNNPLK